MYKPREDIQPLDLRTVTPIIDLDNLETGRTSEVPLATALVSNLDNLDTGRRSDVPLVSNHGLQTFIAESEQMLQDFTLEIQFRHREFVNSLVKNKAFHLPVLPTPKVPRLDNDNGFASLFIPSARTQTTGTPPQAASVASTRESPRELSEPALSERAFKEGLAEIMGVSKIKESVAGLLVPMQRDLKRMASDITNVQATVDRLEQQPSKWAGEKSTGTSRWNTSDPSRRPDADGPEQLTTPWESLMKSTAKANQRVTLGTTDFSSKERVEAEAGLARNATNMNFAADMLGSYSADNVEDLLFAMNKCELPNYKHRGVCCVHTEPERKGPLARVLANNWFERGISLVIALNAAFITYSANYAVSHPENPSSSFISTVEVIFQIIYMIELILKLGVHRLYFFVNRDFMWNCLDTFLVIGAVYDLVMTYFGPQWAKGYRGASGANNGFSLTFLRILRLLRLTKVIRIFRVMRFFSELNVLLKVVMSTLRPLFWCSFMLVTFFYIFAVVFTHGTASYLASSEAEFQSLKTKDLLDKFGSVWRSMISLYKASTGGADWGDVAEPLLLCGYTYYGLFLFFIAFVILALLNILTGLFVDRAMRGVAEDKDGMAIEKLHNDRAVVADLCKIFCAMTGQDIDQNARIGQEHFQQFMSSPVMRARLAVLDLEIWDSTKFFKMLTSISQTSQVDLATFVTGCMQLRGPAKRVNLQAVHSEVRGVRHHVKAAQHFQHELGRHLLGGASLATSNSGDGSRQPDEEGKIVFSEEMRQGSDDFDFSEDTVTSC